jgi:hypothetical protein
MFFSEEKNQKTFDSAQGYRSRPWPDRFNLVKDKSLLVLFFRKERLSCSCYVPALACGA